MSLMSPIQARVVTVRADRGRLLVTTGGLKLASCRGGKPLTTVNRCR